MSGPFHRVLVAVDGSRASEQALRTALALATPIGGRPPAVRVLHVIDSPYAYPEAWYGDGPPDVESLRRLWRNAGLGVLDRAATVARETGVVVETALPELDGRRIARVITDEAERWHADLVVVGSHGQRAAELLGSVADAVARTAPSSVLVVRGM